jgi:hypothetical protein
MLVQSLSGYEHNSVVSGFSDTTAIVFVFNRSKDHFDESQAIFCFLTSYEALETVLNQVATTTDSIRFTIRS